MIPVMRDFHIEDEAGNRDGEKERGWVCGCGCGCGCGWGDAACGGGYVCSCFCACAKAERNMKNKEWTIAFCLYMCIGTMQGIKVSKQGAGWFLYLLLLYWILVWVIIMSRTNESDALPINK